MKKLLFPISLVVLSLILASSALMKNQINIETGSNLSQSEADLMVRTHNKWRNQVGVAHVKWSVELAKSAQKWADELGRRGCEMRHSSNREYGENIFWSSGMNPTAEYVTDDWAEEIKYYKKGTKISYSNYAKFGHYTQMVWSSTTEIGCGRARCSHGEEVWVCQYNPAGNYIGQKPYDETVKVNKSQNDYWVDTHKNTAIYTNENTELNTEIKKNTGSDLSANEANLMVKTHNKWRNQVGVPHVKWSVEVAKSAQKWADELGRRGCEMKHSSNQEYGENIFWSSGAERSADYVTDSWGKEIKYYRKGTKITYSNYSKFGHYTQMIWANTTEIGCGRARCSHGKEVWVCQYNPAGNHVGQKPY